MLAFGLSLLGGWMARAADDAPLGVFFPAAAIHSESRGSAYTSWTFSLPSYRAADDFTFRAIVETDWRWTTTSQRIVGAQNESGLLHFFAAYYSATGFGSSCREGAKTSSNVLDDANLSSELQRKHTVTYTANSSHAQIALSAGDYSRVSPQKVHSFAAESDELVSFFCHGAQAMSQSALIWGLESKPYVIHPMQGVTKTHKGAWSTYNHEFYTTEISA